MHLFLHEKGNGELDLEAILLLSLLVTVLGLCLMYIAMKTICSS